MKNAKPYTIRPISDPQVRCPKCDTATPKEKITLSPRRVLGYECLACGHEWPAHSPAPARPIDSIWAKVARAEEHIADLKTEIDRAKAADPALFRVEGALAPDQKEFRFTGYAEAVPQRMVTIASDAIQNLRVPLDHMIWALAEKHGAKAQDRQVGFMAYTDPEEFQRDARRKAPIGPAIHILESLQPYHSESPKDAPMFVLVDLHNRDKHKTLLAIGTTGNLRRENLLAIDAGRPATVAHLSPAPPQPLPLTPEGTVLLSMRFVEEVPRAKLDMVHGFDIQVTLAEAGPYSRLPLVEALYKLRDAVKRALSAFEPFL